MNFQYNVRADLFPALFKVVMVLAAVNLTLSPQPAAGDTTTKPVRIVAFGDSLTAGYLLKPSQSFPSQLAAALQKRGLVVDVINAGVSGETMSQGLARLDWSIPDGTDAVILELGANDVLRGIDPGVTRAALDQILQRLGERNIDVLVAGMRALRNWGSEYEAAFNPIFEDLSKKYQVLHYPFFLDGVAADPQLNLSDGLHPNSAGIAKIVERIMPNVLELITRVERRRASRTPVRVEAQ